MKKIKKRTDQVNLLKNQRIQSFSKIKVFNDIQKLHPRQHTKYSIVFDRKYLKFLNRLGYRRETLYDQFQNLYKVINATVLEIEFIFPY